MNIGHEGGIGGSKFAKVTSRTAHVQRVDQQPEIVPADLAFDRDRIFVTLNLRERHELEGDLDVRGLLGLDDSVSPGYEQIRIGMNVKAACSDEELDDLLAYTQQHSPVCNTVCRPVPVKIERVAV